MKKTVWVFGSSHSRGSCDGEIIKTYSYYCSEELGYNVYNFSIDDITNEIILLQLIYLKENYEKLNIPNPDIIFLELRNHNENEIIFNLDSYFLSSMKNSFIDGFIHDFENSIKQFDLFKNLKFFENHNLPDISDYFVKIKPWDSDRQYLTSNDNINKFIFNKIKLISNDFSKLMYDDYFNFMNNISKIMMIYDFAKQLANNIEIINWREYLPTKYYTKNRKRPEWFGLFFDEYFLKSKLENRYNDNLFFNSEIFFKYKFGERAADYLKCKCGHMKSDFHKEIFNHFVERGVFY